MLARCSSQVIDTGIPLPDFSECSDSDFVSLSPSPMPIAPSDSCDFGMTMGSSPCKTVTPQQLAELIADPHSGGFEQVIIIDARFEYEFRGGHIIGARNVRSKAQLYGIYDRYRNKHYCIVFHCEFSQNRGPTLLRLFREYDRHHNDYPNLSFPDIYLLEGGYRQFYDMMPDLCYGKYIPMRDETYVNNGELRKSHSFFMKEMLSQKRLVRPPRLLTRCNSQTIDTWSIFADAASATLPSITASKDASMDFVPFTQSQIY